MCECKKCPNCGYSPEETVVTLPENFWDNIPKTWKALYHFGDGHLILSNEKDLFFENSIPCLARNGFTQDVTWVFEIKNIHKLRDKFYKWERP